MNEKEKPGSPDMESWAKDHKNAHDIHGTEKRLQIMLETNINLRNHIQLPLRMSAILLICGLRIRNWKA